MPVSVCFWFPIFHFVASPHPDSAPDLPVALRSASSASPSSSSSPADASSQTLATSQNPRSPPPRPTTPPWIPPDPALAMTASSSPRRSPPRL
ncbi:hypothetical protein DAI22_11g150500 [Oryza sativa Japonica Group]|nr:hypothetical protein DAI22_11g150500 [Oryza sativa Japonica Group]